MRYFESNHRYKLHKEGFHYIAEFAWRNQKDRDLFFKLKRNFEEQYGPYRDKEFLVNNALATWKYNEHWRAEQNVSAKRIRIYLREESALSMALLKIG
jgi:hypothetical protein